MRVLVTTFAARSHLNFLVPVAWALRAAGHDVRIASQPNLVADIQDAGLLAVPVGQELDLARYVREVGHFPGDRSVFDIAETREEKLTADYVRGALALYSAAISGFLCDESMVDDLVRFASAWRPDLVIWDAWTYAGPVAAKASGAAHVRMLFGPDHIGRMRRLFHRIHGRAAAGCYDPMGMWLGARLSRHGQEFAEDAVVGQRTIDPMPSWMRLPVDDIDYLPVRFVPYAGRAPVPEWVLEPPRRPRVCLTLGLAARDYGMPGPPATTLLAAIAELDVEVVATLDAAQLAPTYRLPENVRVVAMVSLDALLPTCSAVVHHFGAGTMATAVLHGVPQVWVPDGLNLWGERGMVRQLVDRGAAVDIDPASTPAEFAAGVEAVVCDPTYRRNAERLSALMRATSSPHDIVGELELLAANRTGRPVPVPS